MWHILIITKDYDRVFEKINKYITPKWHTKYESQFKTDLLSITVLHIRPSENLRGFKADLIYVDEELYDNLKIRNELLIPMAPRGKVLPIKYLYQKLDIS